MTENDRRIAELEKELGLSSSKRKEGEDTWLEATGRTLAQLPRGTSAIVPALQDFVHLPKKLWDVSKGKTPHSYTQEHLVNYDKRYQGKTEPKTAAQRMLSTLVTDIGSMIATGGVGSLTKTLGQKGGAALGTSSFKKIPKSFEKTGVFLEKIGKPTRTNLGSATGASLLPSFLSENSDQELSPQAALASSLAGSVLGGKVARFKKTPNLSLAEKDALTVEAAKRAHDKASSRVNRLRNPLTQRLDETPNISFEEPVEALLDKFSKIKEPALQESFLLGEEGKVLKKLLLLSPKINHKTFETIVKNMSKGHVSPSFPKVTLTATQNIRNDLNDVIARMGGFEIGGERAALPLKDLSRKIAQSRDKGVSSLGPKEKKQWDISSRIWDTYKKKKEPLIQDIHRNRHIVGDPFEASLKKVDKGATHANFVLNNLRGDDKRKYAASVLKELKLGKSTLSSPHGLVKGFTTGTVRKIGDLFSRPVERQKLYQAATRYAKPSQKLFSFIPQSTDIMRSHPKFFSFTRKESTMTENDRRIAELEKELKIPST